MPLGLHGARGHHHIVEHAKPAAPISEGVVGASGQVDRHPAGQRSARGSHARAHRATRTLDHLGRPWKADLALLRRAERAVHHGTHVAVRVGQRQFAKTGQRSLGDLDTGEFGRHALSQQAVLDHRESMPLRQREHEVV